MKKSIDALKVLGVDMINEANSGHPGMVLGASPIVYTLFSKHLRTDPTNPNWINRDRFVLAAGHGSALLYSALHLSGFDLSMDDLKKFRKVKSKTPGHPEIQETPGVDVSSGPLGQGIATGAGLAIAESYLASKFNSNTNKVIDHFTYVLCGDGDLQEGVTQEAISLAGHLQLEKLIVLFDSNDIQLDGDVSMTNTEDAKTKFESMNWHYQKVEDGTDVNSISEAIKLAKRTIKPSIIEIKTKIGADSPLEGDSASHGAPLKEENTNALRSKLGWTNKPFDIPKDVYEDFQKNVKLRGQLEYEKWLKYYDIAVSDSNAKISIKDYLENPDVINTKMFDNMFDNETDIATRASFGKALTKFQEKHFNIIGGSADLTKSTKVKGIDGDFHRENPSGRNINFGVREHAMGAIVNGITVHSNLKGFSGAFFVFSDYMKPSMRLASLMDLPSMFFFTHDSLAVGEDGPTHQPVEQLTGLRAIPNMNVIRPADANESAAALLLAVTADKTPTTVVLSRQNLPVLENSTYENVSKGAYVISKAENSAVGQLIAAGSEVSECIKAQDLLAQENIYVDVISMPSHFLFEQQSEKYKNEVLSQSIEKRLAVEMGSSLSWYKYATNVMAVDTFGLSGPASDVIKSFKFTANDIANRFKNIKM